MRVFAASTIERFSMLDQLFIQLGNIKWCRPVKTDELHLTFRFFGEIPEPDVEELKRHFRQIDGKKFRIEVDGLGAFPVSSRANVLFLRVQPQKEIEHDWKEIASIEPAEATSHKGFVPHITVARFRKPHNATAILEEYRDISFGVDIDHISLYSSVLTAEKPLYSILETVQLK